VRDFIQQFEKVENMLGSFKKNRGLRRKLEKMMGDGGQLDMSKLSGMMGGKS